MPIILDYLVENEYYLTWPKPIYNSHYGNEVPYCRQCLLLSVVQLKGKHCRKPHCPNGVVDTFELVQYQYHSAPCTNYITKNLS